MRPAFTSAVLLSLATCCCAGVADAQSVRADPASHMNTPGMPGSPMNPSDLEKMRGADDRNSAQAKALATAESSKIVTAIGLPCEVTDAEWVGRGHVSDRGKTIDLKVYEVACKGGTGFLLESGGQSPLATSCFAAEATHAADIVEGRKSDLYCQLPANKDIKAMAGNLLATTSTSCGVKDVRWFGLSTSRETEYAEVACSDGHGYLLRLPRTAAAAQVSALGCRDAATQGLKCHLTDGGPVSTPVTLATFRDALKQNGVSCEPDHMRVVGRERVDKRYVVEVQCPQQPAGLVAFIPLEGSTNKFEAIDCLAAVDRGVTCQFTNK
jgi:hypothetical protein